jgi:hypothetical protein
MNRHETRPESIVVILVILCGLGVVAYSYSVRNWPKTDFYCELPCQESSQPADADGGNLGK